MDNRTIAYRCFEPVDLPEIIRIQKANFVANISAADKADGFLSVEFPPEQFEEMNRQIPIVVADLGSQLGGYLCGSSLDYGMQFPLIERTIDLCRQTMFGGKAFDAYRSFVYGPVCVDRPLRGSGVVQGLFSRFVQELEGRFDLGVFFVSQDNPRSLRAHYHTLGMEKVRDFTYNDNDYCVLAFSVNEATGP